MITNIPNSKIAVVAVSRDCFPVELSRSRRQAVCLECKKAGIEVTEIETVIENEKQAMAVLDELIAKKIDALVIYLGNFGPEGPTTMLAQKFSAICGGAVMFVAAAEDSADKLIGGRGDAYCGMLSASYNLSLRGVKVYIPEYPVGTPDEVAEMIGGFKPVADAYTGIKNLKIITFGPRPADFYACNSPIKPLFDLGVEVEENSELDLFESFNAHENDERIGAKVDEMKAELGEGLNYSGVLTKLAQYELTLLDWVEAHKGAKKYVAIAGKCWPAFQTQFHFVPCYVNSRLASMGIPVSCEVDIYGALSEYIMTCITKAPATLLDINNSVPRDMYESEKDGKLAGYTNKDLFMGFHCGNTPSCRLKQPKLNFQRIMHRLLEPDSEPNITRGTIEGDIAASDITAFRLHSTVDSKLISYIAEGETIDMPSNSFGSIGVFAIHEMGRFYRYALIEKHYPHHGAVGFVHCGKTLYNLLKLLGVEDISVNLPKGLMYPTENPFK